MDKILNAISAFFRKFIPESVSIEEEVMKLKELVETSTILDLHPVATNDHFITGGEFEKQVEGSIITITNAREYVKITPQSIVYGYRSKYSTNFDQHHMEVNRHPWQYVDEKSNITPGIAVQFLHRYLKRLKKT